MTPHQHLKQSLDLIDAHFAKLGEQFPKPKPNAKHLARDRRITGLIDRIGEVVDNADPDEAADAMWAEWGSVLAERMPDGVRDRVVREAAEAAEYDQERDEA